MKKKTNVCGILSIVFAGVSFFVFWWLSLVAIVLGIIGLDLSETEKTTAFIGIPLASVSLLVNIFVLGVLGILL